ncbi:MAG TPA: hypothetical protein VHE55_04505 [Fimbriimonadaceae bacterium]|nr:hypothetical protein [Fimbriimonadaceae bacterium]
MVLEAPLPKPAGGRPPFFGGPPIGTTFCNDPDDNDDMIVKLRDNVQRLVSQAKAADRESIALFMRLLDQRREWIKGELDVEGMLGESPKAPLGIQENPYDLATLTIDPIDDRHKSYERILESIDVTMSELWDRMLISDDVAE